VHDTTTASQTPIGPAQRELLDQLLDKWSLNVLDELCSRSLRFNDLRRVIPDITQKSLTTTLRRLERNGMVERVVLSTRPVAVEYRISPLGDTLQPLIDAIMQWTTTSLPTVDEARARFDEGQPD
jgi:DNA-binding HxlR family transcriptional regulator